MITWYEDNSMRVAQTVDGSGAGATVTATILDHLGATVGTPVTLQPTGTDDEYAATVHPSGAYDLTAGLRYRLRIEAQFGGAYAEWEHDFRPRVRRG